MTMDIKTGQRLQQTFRTVETLVAAMESYGRALTDAEQRIKQLEDIVRQFELRRPTKYGNRQ